MYFTPLHVLTDEYDPAAGYVKFPRLVGKFTESRETFRLARFWIERCISGTGGECRRKNQPQPPDAIDSSLSSKCRFRSDLPARLVAIEDDACSLRLAELPSTDAMYLTLSYVWGTEEATWKTTSKNLRKREGGFTVRRLPQTLRDAVRITHALGYRLLWVDCLCIVQDDTEEWRKESAKMAMIYNNAIATILADASLSSSSGIFNKRSLSYLDQVPHARLCNRLPDGRRSTLYLADASEWRSRVMDKTLVSTRAWCAQEQVASSRIIHFTKHQLMFECSHGTEFEDNIAIWNPPPRDVRPIFGDPDGFLRDDEYETQMMWARYARYVQFVARDYSPRSLTFPKDRLNAVAGIAARFHSLGLGRYLAGHWESNLLASLLWHANRPTITAQARRSSVYRAPTWSWASQDGPVEWAGDFQAMSEFDADILAVETTVQPSTPFGEVTGGHLRLRAPALEARVKVDGRGDFYVQYVNGMREQLRGPEHLDDAAEASESIALVACALGIVPKRYGPPGSCSSYSLLLRHDGGSYKRVGLLETLYLAGGHGELGENEYALEQLELKRQAPVREFLIV